MIIFVLASLTEFEHGIIREARVPVPVGRNAHSIWAAEQIVIMMSSSRTGKTEGPQRIGFQGDIRRRDGEARLRLPLVTAMLGLPRAARC